MMENSLITGIGLGNLVLHPGAFSTSSTATTLTKHSYKALAVRHPMDRLLTAYIYVFRQEATRKKKKITAKINKAYYFIIINK